MTPETALAVYGSLLPGETNHHAMLGIDGTWIDGFIYGYLFELTWGPADGYLGVVLDPRGNRIPLKIVVSNKLSSHWRRLDDFEGPGYRRVPVDVYRQIEAATDVDVETDRDVETDVDVETDRDVETDGDVETETYGDVSEEPELMGQAYIFEALTDNDD